MRATILIVEDDPAIASFLRRGLIYEGYNASVVESGEEALPQVEREHPALLILDWMLPGIGGLELLHQLRAAGNEVPVLMLTARESVPDRVAGLKAGADDYLIKPFAFEELLARVEALLRRHESDETLHFADLLLHPAAYSARRGERALSLTAREFELLELFMRHPRQVLSRDTLYERVWGYDFGPDSNVIEVFMRNIRSKLEAANEPRLLQTVRGVGYVLREPEGG